MNYNKIVLYDLEMCCWAEGEYPKDKPRGTGEIIEIGLAEIDLQKKNITRTAQYYVKPDKDKISQFCVDLTGITQKVVDKQGRPLEAVLKTVQKNFGGNNKIFGSWGRDDLILFDECFQKGLENPFKEHLNIATLYRLQNQTGNLKVSQINAMQKYGLEFEGRQHSGLVDAVNLARLTLKMFE